MTFERNLVIVAIGIVGFLGMASYYSIPNTLVDAENTSGKNGSVPASETATSETATSESTQSENCNGNSIECMSECLDLATIQYAQRLGASEEEARIRVRGDADWIKSKHELMQGLATANLLGKAVVGEEYSVADTDGVKLFLLNMSETGDETLASDYKECLLDYERLERKQ